MTTADLTPCQFDDKLRCYLKREDLACFIKEALPSGAKVRQYLAMIANAPGDAVLAVGCTASSAMQVYVAAIAKLINRRAYITVPKRRVRTPSTEWSINTGATVFEVRPGYPNFVRAYMRQTLSDHRLTAVHWNSEYAIRDTAAQVANIPDHIQRIVIPNGSGLTATGVIGGLYQHNKKLHVLIVSTCDSIGKPKHILKSVASLFGQFVADSANIAYQPQSSSYHKPIHASLADGTALDPFYAAKAVQYCSPTDLLWITGRRPIAACYPT